MADVQLLVVTVALPNGSWFAFQTVVPLWSVIAHGVPR